LPDVFTGFEFADFLTEGFELRCGSYFAGAQRARSSGVMAASSSGVHRISLPFASWQYPFFTQSFSSATALFHCSGELANLVCDVVSDFSVGGLFDFMAVLSVSEPAGSGVQQAVDEPGGRAELIVKRNALIGALRACGIFTGTYYVTFLGQALRRGLAARRAKELLLAAQAAVFARGV
jgi:hypothetical protein